MAKFYAPYTTSDTTPVDFLSYWNGDYGSHARLEELQAHADGTYTWTLGIYDSYHGYPLRMVDLKIEGAVVDNGNLIAGYVTSMTSGSGGWVLSDEIGLLSVGSIRDALNGAFDKLTILKALFRGNDTIKIDGDASGQIIHGYAGYDRITTGDYDDQLFGDEGDDILVSGAGTDRLFGGEGNDTLYGGDGNDVLDGELGSDRMLGGFGDDTYIVDDTGDRITEKTAEGADRVKATVSYVLSANIEKLVLEGSDNLNGTGNSLINALTGNAGNNILDGKGGADTMAGGLGNDTYVVENSSDRAVELVGAGTDVVQSSVNYTLGANVEHLTLIGAGNTVGTGNGLANEILGSRGNNTLNGGAGNDLLKGAAGDDKLNGGTGADKLYGGSGIDTFVFTSVLDSTVSAAGRDTIYDFARSLGERIDLRAIDAKTDASGDQAFRFIGTKAFTKESSELRYEAKDGDTLIQGDVNGDGKADFTIALDIVTSLNGADFIL